MKFSVRQMLASAAGAVVAASIASLFGVKGTIIGVAIGSAAATFGTALAAQSLERTHQAVRQVVVKAPEDSLLRRLGRTDSVGDVSTNSTATEAPVTKAVTDGPPTAVVPAEPAESAGSADDTDSSRRFSWRALAGTAAIVFVLALGFVTAVELIAGKPLSDIFGGHSSGGSTTVQNIFGGSSKPAVTTTTTTTVPPSTTTSTTAGTTTTTSGSTTTSTTTPLTTTVPTSTTLPGSSTTTTTTPP